MSWGGAVSWALLGKVSLRKAVRGSKSFVSVLLRNDKATRLAKLPRALEVGGKLKVSLEMPRS